MYASIALDNTGIPAIAYFRRGNYNTGSALEDGPSTALVYVIATRTQPTTKDHWTIVGAGNTVGGDVDAANRPAPPCNNACSSTQVGVVDPAAAGGDRCASPSSAACNPGQTPSGCTGNQTCVED